MIRVAHGIGGDRVKVKFQLYNAEDDKGKPHFDWVKAHELTFEQAKDLFEYGASIGTEVFFSVFGVKYVQWCERIGVKRYKLAAGQWGAKQVVLREIADNPKPMVVSMRVGGRLHKASKCDESLILWCPVGYPAKVQHMPLFGEKWDGFSDHTIGLDAAKIALARGAQVIEKHFVLEHNPSFPDYRWSMTPQDLIELLRWEKVCHEALG